jgi:serine/threonine protein kinase
MDRQKEILGQLFDAAETDAASESLFDCLMKVDRPYLRLNKVGSGAMKEIFRTEDRKTGRLVAMAVLKNYEDSKAVESFLREARINAKLQHPHIVPVYDIDVDENQRPYFIMKLLPGTNLKQIIKDLNSGQSEALKKYPLPVLLDIFLKVCEAVAYAHAQGICHLDLKPDNIRVSSYGEVMVCDWGLANFIEEASLGEIDNQTAEDSLGETDNFLHYNSRYKTLQGQVKGTPGYMAPEQAAGNREVKDQRTDIFSLGCILYELLTHCEAIEGEGLKEVLKNTCSKSPIAPSKRSPALFIPESLEAICLKAVQILPSERYAQVEHIISEIGAYRSGFATKAEEPSVFKQISLLLRRHKVFSISIFLLLTLLISVSVDFINRIRSQEKLAVQALNKALRQRNVIFTILNKLDDAENLKKKTGRDSAVVFAEKAVVEFKEENLEVALECAQLALLLDNKNQLANITIAKIKMSKGEFVKAIQIMERKGYVKEDEEFIKFCKAAIDFRRQKEISYQSMYELLKENISSYRTPFINIMLKPYLHPFDKTELLKEQLTWLLKSQNNLDELKLDLIYKAKKFRVDLSGNSKLKDIFFLRILPITELNISNSSFNHTKLLSEMKLKVLHINSTPIKSLKFVNSMKSLKELHISKGAFPQSVLNRLPKKIKIIESSNF